MSDGGPGRAARRPAPRPRSLGDGDEQVAVALRRGRAPASSRRPYNVIANPVLWFIQHQMWEPCPSGAGYRRQPPWWRGSAGTLAMNEAFASAMRAQARGDRRPRIMLHDYHLYCAREPIRRLRRARYQPLHAHPDAAVLDLATVRATDPRGHRAVGLLANDVVAPDRSLRAQLPAHGRVVRARRDGRLRGFAGPAPPPHHCWSAGLPDQHRTVEDNRSIAGSRGGGGAGPTTLAAHASRSSCSVDRLEPSKNRSCADSSRTRRSSSARRGSAADHLPLGSSCPSRTGLREYGQYGRQVQNAVDRSTPRFGRAGWRPIQLFYENDYAQGARRSLDRRRRARQHPRRRHEPRRQGGRHRLRARRGAVLSELRSLRPDGRRRLPVASRRRRRHRRCPRRRAHDGRSRSVAAPGVLRRGVERGTSPGGCAASSRTWPSSPARVQSPEIRASSSAASTGVSSTTSAAAVTSGATSWSAPPTGRWRRGGGHQHAGGHAGEHVEVGRVVAHNTTPRSPKRSTILARGRPLVAEGLGRTSTIIRPCPIRRPSGSRCRGRPGSPTRRRRDRAPGGSGPCRHALLIGHHSGIDGTRANASSRRDRIRLRAPAPRRVRLPGFEPLGAVVAGDQGSPGTPVRGAERQAASAGDDRDHRRRSASAASAPSAPSTSPAMNGSVPIGASVPSNRSAGPPARPPGRRSPAPMRASAMQSVRRLDSGTVKRLSLWALPIILGVTGVAAHYHRVARLGAEPPRACRSIPTPWYPGRARLRRPRRRVSPPASSASPTPIRPPPDANAAHSRRRRRRPASDRPSHQRPREQSTNSATDGFPRRTRLTSSAAATSLDATRTRTSSPTR